MALSLCFRTYPRERDLRREGHRQHTHLRQDQPTSLTSSRSLLTKRQATDQQQLSAVGYLRPIWQGGREDALYPTSVNSRPRCGIAGMYSRCQWPVQSDRLRSHGRRSDSRCGRVPEVAAGTYFGRSFSHLIKEFLPWETSSVSHGSHDYKILQKMQEGRRSHMSIT